MNEYDLTFSDLRTANKMRVPQYRNKEGGIAHSKEDGSDWSPSQWLGALIGEIGEYASLRKSYERGDISYQEFKYAAEKELADIQCYLDLLARRCLDTKEGAPHPAGIDLGRATVRKFNEVSLRVGSNVFLDPDGPHYHGDWPVQGS